MKKILLGLLIVAGLSACSSSKEKEMDIPTQVQELNKTVSSQTLEINTLREETKDMKAEIDKLDKLIDESQN